MKTKTCCITGHRNIHTTKINQVKASIKQEIMQAIADGYTQFISGFAEGVDLYFAEIVGELKSQHQITLMAAIPYKKRMSTNDDYFQNCLKQCDQIEIIAEEYSKACFFNRNRFMVNRSQRVIGVYDGRQAGGTFFTIDYANAMEREVKIINI